MNKVLIFTTGMGHQSIAEAVKEAFVDAGWITKIHFSKFSEISLGQNINFFSSNTNHRIIQLAQNKKFLPIFKRVRTTKKKPKIEKIITDFGPSLVISTYPLFNSILESLKRRHRFLFFNIVSNPRTIKNSIELSDKVDLNILYDQKAVKKAVGWGIDEKKLAAIGWLTRKRFYQSFSKNHKPKKGEITVLLCAGSWGNLEIIKFLPVFLKLPPKFNLYLVAGKNKLLFRIFKIFAKAAQKKIKIKIFSFVENLNELIAQSDIFCGKAGPNLIFDSIACGKPFCTITHYLGQEDGNLEIIRERNLGWVAETPKSFESLLLKIINNPKILLNCQKDILSERNKNLAAGKKLVKLAEKLTTIPRH